MNTFGYNRIVEIFDTDETAGSFLREDGEGGFSSGVYRMAREIERLRAERAEMIEAANIKMIAQIETIASLRAENERLQRHAKSMIDEMNAENERLRAELDKSETAYLAVVAEYNAMKDQRDALIKTASDLAISEASLRAQRDALLAAARHVDENWGEVDPEIRMELRTAIREAGGMIDLWDYLTGEGAMKGWDARKANIAAAQAAREQWGGEAQAEIERLRAERDALQHEVGLAHKLIDEMAKERSELLEQRDPGTENERLRALRDLLEYLDRRGGLGLDIHDRIRAAIREAGG